MVGTSLREPTGSCPYVIIDEISAHRALCDYLDACICSSSSDFGAASRISQLVSKAEAHHDIIYSIAILQSSRLKLDLILPPLFYDIVVGSCN
jgi:hypothetical protein